MQPVITSGIKYSDNPRLTTGVAQIETWNTSLASRLEAMGRTERTDFSTKIDLNAQRYPDNQLLDNDNGGVELGLRRKNIYDQWNITAAYRNESTLVSELEDTGYVQIHRRRYSQQLAPSWQWMFAENNSLQLGYQYQQAAYGAGATNLYDYTNQMLSAGWLYNWNERTQLSTTLYGSRYESAESGAEYKDRGLQFGIGRSVTGLWTANLVVGAHQLTAVSTRYLFGVFKFTRRDEDIGGLINASLERRGERTTYAFSLSRGIEPSGSGFATQRDRLSLTISHRYTPHVLFTLTTSAIRNEALQENINGINRQYYNIQPRLTWNFTQEWALAANYSFARQRYEQVSQAATENAIAISLSYIWPKIIDAP